MPDKTAVAVTLTVTMGTPMPLTVRMSVAVVVGMRMGTASRGDTGVGFKFLHATSVKTPGVHTCGLHTGMRQGLDDGL